MSTRPVGGSSVKGVRGLLCLVHGGHHWQTAADGAGSVTTCIRCGALRHKRVESASYGEFKGHTDVAFKWPSMPSHGTDELDEN